MDDIEDACDYDRDYDDFGSDDERLSCHTCHGDGCGIVGTDWDCDDGINGPYNGESERCPNCRGSRLEKDCWYW